MTSRQWDLIRKKGQDLKNLIRKLSKTKTIVLSTHILSDVEEVADYIILIKEGCLTKFEKIGGKDNE